MEIVDVVATRFGDRPVPADLSALVAIPLAGDGLFNQVEIAFIEPGRGHPLLDNSYLNDDDRANPDTMANVAAIEEVLRHAVFVAYDRDDRLYGYWLHPDESAGPPAVVCFSSEGEFSIEGRSLTEAMVSARAFGEREFARLTQLFADAGVPTTARSLDEFVEPAVATSPVDLHDRLYRMERAKRGLPDL